MSEDEAFRDLICRVRASDTRASAELVRQFEPAIRVAAHVRLTDPGLRRRCDPEDICQSVLASFFVRLALGQYELQTPAQLLGLLAAMVRNKVAKQAEKQRAARRDHRRHRADTPGADDLADSGPTPSRIVADRELVEEVRRRLSPKERRLAELRAAGTPWDEIAAETGERPDALRKRLDRAIKLVLVELGVEV